MKAGKTIGPMDHQPQKQQVPQSPAGKPINKQRRTRRIRRIIAESFIETASEGFQKATGNPFGRTRRFPKGDRKALWSHPQMRNPPHHTTIRKTCAPCVTPAKQHIPSATRRRFHKHPSRSIIASHAHCHHRNGTRRFPKGDRKALWPHPQMRNPPHRTPIRKTCAPCVTPAKQHTPSAARRRFPKHPSRLNPHPARCQTTASSAPPPSITGAAMFQSGSG